MSDDDKLSLRPARAQEIEESLSLALRYAGRKRVHHADDAMARNTAERLRVVLPHIILLPAASLRMLPAAPIVTVFLGSVGRRFSVPAMVRRAVARSLGQPWPQATAGGGAQRVEPGEHGGKLARQA